MHRRDFLRAGAVTSTLLAGCGTRSREPPQTTTQTSSGLRNSGFERGLNSWSVGTDLPEGINATVEPADDMASRGEQSVGITIDGAGDDGTAWVQQSVDLAGMETLAVDVYSPEESFNTLRKVAAYAGPVPQKGGLTEAEFNTDEAVEDHSGWKTYTYPVRFDTTGLVAVGVSVVWETTVTRYLDEVRLSG